MIQNTAPFDITGHPALSINARTKFQTGDWDETDALPVGMMIVGKHHDDITVLKVARAFENLTAAKMSN